MERPCPAHGQPGPARWREARAGAGDGDGLLQKRPARRLSACAAGGLYGSESLAEVACTLDGIVSAGRHATVSASGRNHVTTPEARAHREARDRLDSATAGYARYPSVLDTPSPAADRLPLGLR